MSEPARTIVLPPDSYWLAFEMNGVRREFAAPTIHGIEMLLTICGTQTIKDKNKDKDK